MSSLVVGCRVVRGPDWKWGDQDGGEGYAGTIIPTSPADQKLLGPRTVTVAWDIGTKFNYQGGPEGFYDLRIISCSALGLRHTNISCGNDSCWVQEIQGFRWQCVTCGLNLCTNCFLQKIPHNILHNNFKRFDSHQSKTPIIIYCWQNGKGPDNRIELKGLYPGALVNLSPEWPYRRENEKMSGVVIPAPKEEVLGRIIVEWDGSKERTHYQQSNNLLRIKSPGIGGCYHSTAFPSLEIKIPSRSNRVYLPLLMTLSIGDRVCINPAINLEELKLKQTNHGNFVDGMYKLIGVVGTVQATYGSSAFVKYRGSAECCWIFNPTVLVKLNKFSVNQIISIRKDEITVKEIQKHYPANVCEKLIGAIGRISHISEENPDYYYVTFNTDGIHKAVFLARPLPYAWMELIQLATPTLEQEILDGVSKAAPLLLKAIQDGDLPAVKLLHKHHKFNYNARINSDGMTALQIACGKGYKDLVEWLIDEAKVDLDLATEKGFRAVHYAVQKCWTEILEILILKGVDLDVQTDDGRTALHIAVSNRFTDCSRLLTDAGCDPNFQDADGNTPLHLAILNGIAICVEQILPKLFINFGLRNKMGFNVLHLAVVKDDLRAIELLMNEGSSKDPLLESMPNSQSTILHYAVNHNNFQTAKLLIEKSSSAPDGTLLSRLLEAKNESGKTAFLMASLKKDCALIELLVEAGADVNAADQDGNTAILLAAYCPFKDATPSKDFSPAIFKAYQNISIDPAMKLLDNLPFLSLIIYLMTKGCYLDIANNAGIKTSSILLRNGYPPSIVQILARFASTGQIGSDEIARSIQVPSSMTNTEPEVINLDSDDDVIEKDPSPELRWVVEKIHQEKRKADSKDDEFQRSPSPKRASRLILN